MEKIELIVGSAQKITYLFLDKRKQHRYNKFNMEMLCAAGNVFCCG